jgi:hypothetical protein
MSRVYSCRLERCGSRRVLSLRIVTPVTSPIHLTMHYSFSAVLLCSEYRAGLEGRGGSLKKPKEEYVGWPM